MKILFLQLLQNPRQIILGKKVAVISPCFEDIGDYLFVVVLVQSSSRHSIADELFGELQRSFICGLIITFLITVMLR